jgi:hypothetical protein
MNLLDRGRTASTVQCDLIGDHIRPKGNTWYRAGEIVSANALFIVLMLTMRMGQVRWEDNRIVDLLADFVVKIGIPEDIRDGYNPYSSVLLLDEDGLFCTFSSSSWGGRNALRELIGPYRLTGQQMFPRATLGTRIRHNQYSTVDPVFVVKDWVPRAKFAALIGDGGSYSPALLPQPRAEFDGKSSAEILGDEIPFAWVASLLIPLAVMVAAHVA